MNTMVKELLNRQENERVEMATLLVSNTKEMLSNLGCDYMLSTAPGTDVSKYEAIINSLKEELKAVISVNIAERLSDDNLRHLSTKE